MPGAPMTPATITTWTARGRQQVATRHLFADCPNLRRARWVTRQREPKAELSPGFICERCLNRQEKTR